MDDFGKPDITYHFDDLKMSELVRCGIAIRGLGKHARSMKEAAGKAINYFFDNFTDRRTNEKSCVLVRLFKAHNFYKLPLPLQTFAAGLLQNRVRSKSYKCLTLLASAGIGEVWNDIKKSVGHQAIPLPCVGVVKRIPMICSLIKQMGIDVKTVIRPAPELIADLSRENYSVFYVPDAFESPYIPAQDNFVKPYGIKSVLGFGSILSSGNVFVVIIFF